MSDVPLQWAGPGGSRQHRAVDALHDIGAPPAGKGDGDSLRMRQTRMVSTGLFCSDQSIGGGPAGTTVAKDVLREEAGAIGVTLVEPPKQYATCFFSNLYLGGLRDL